MHSASVEGRRLFYKLLAWQRAGWGTCAPRASGAGKISVHRRPQGRHVDAAVAYGPANRCNMVRTQEHVYCARAGWREKAPRAAPRAGLA